MANFEQYANNAVTTLASSITSGATSLTVTDASRFPANGNFRILVEGELMLVTDRTGATFTVTRGIETTNAVAHNGGVQVAFIVTEESFRRLVSDHLPFFQGQAVGPLNSMTNTSGASVTASSFTATNQGTSTLTDIGSPVVGMKLLPPAGTGANLRVYTKSAPSTPYTIYTALSVNIYPSATISHGGMCFRENGTGKVKVFGLASGTITATVHDTALSIGNYTNPTTFSAWDTQTGWAYNPTLVWCAIEDDGTNIKMHISNNGIEFQQVLSETRGTFFTTAPDEVGLYFNTDDANAVQSLLCNHWSEQ